MKKYEFFEHTADIGLRGFGKDIKEAFENAAIGLFSLMYDITKVKQKKTVEIISNGYDLESLFVDWLNTLLSVSDIERVAFSKFKINDLNLEKYILKGVAMGDEIKPEFKPHIEVKAATYSNLRVEKRRNFYIVQCILDI